MGEVGEGVRATSEKMFYLYVTHQLCWALTNEKGKNPQSFFYKKKLDPGLHMAKNRAVELLVPDENMRRVIII